MFGLNVDSQQVPQAARGSPLRPHGYLRRRAPLGPPPQDVVWSETHLRDIPRLAVMGVHAAGAPVPAPPPNALSRAAAAAAAASAAVAVAAAGDGGGVDEGPRGWSQHDDSAFALGLPRLVPSSPGGAAHAAGPRRAPAPSAAVRFDASRIVAGPVLSVAGPSGAVVLAPGLTGCPAERAKPLGAAFIIKMPPLLASPVR